MRVPSSRTVLIAAPLALAALLGGCGSEEIQLKKAPPVPIGAAKKEEATKDQSALKSGAPPRGSSSGMNHNPSETPR